MKTRTGRFGALTVVAVMATMSAAPTMATASSGGTITFSGAIVAPQFEISAASAAGASVGATGAQLARVASSAGTVTFNAPSGVASGAEVALQVNGGATARDDAVATRFVDGSGRVFAAARDGHYRVGRDGGVLSLSLSAKQRAVVAEETRVTVIVSYD